MNQTEKKVFEEGGLDYTVSKRKFHLPSIGETNYYAIVNDENNEVISTCKERYKVVQNKDVMEIIKNIFPDSELSICGSFDNGGKTFHFLKAKQFSIGNEPTIYYYYVLNSHDGSSGLRFGIASQVLSCSNIFNTLPGESAFVLKHTENLEVNANIKAQIIQSLRQMINNETECLSDWYVSRCTPRDLLSPQFHTVIKKAMGVDHRVPDESLTAKQKVRFQLIKDSCRKEMGTKGYNLFGFYNGFTHFCTHVLNQNDTSTETNYKSILKGVGNQINTRAFKAIQQLHESRKKPS